MTVVRDSPPPQSCTNAAYRTVLCVQGLYLALQEVQEVEVVCLPILSNAIEHSGTLRNTQEH